MGANGIAVAKVDLKNIKPYGDTMNDGMMELTFTLPVPYGPEADEAAKILGRKMGLDEVSVVFSKDLGQGFTFFAMYGKCRHTVDFTAIKVAKADVEVMSREECQKYIENNIRRDVVVVGATTGTDAHTVGIDAIMNMKGFHGHYGLERYKGIEAINMGSQVSNEALVAKAIETGADAILVSQIVTQKDVHISNMTNLVEIIEAEGIRSRVVLCCGGPRISYELAQELGYDAGFGPHSYAEEVASFVLTEMVRRKLV
ncbi:MAG: cobalamin-dependent protein [Clostridiales Family XIII bacterium]|jgi:beta-lysine 5,6-aminomutase beta subunit|nr:cobalamin-dependent protein [Clostridiales Family XIII bacterium]